MQKTIGRRAEKAAWGDESKSEDLPVDKYPALRTKEKILPCMNAANRSVFAVVVLASVGGCAIARSLFCVPES